MTSNFFNHEIQIMIAIKLISSHLNYLIFYAGWTYAYIRDNNLVIQQYWPYNLYWPYNIEIRQEEN